MNLRLIHELDRCLRITNADTELLRYVHRPDEPRLESPRPYFHPLRTLTGRLVSLYRPHDHVWHKGIAWSLPNVDTENFWGGTTYRRGQGYRQLDNNGATVHREFTRLDSASNRIDIGERLDWITQAGRTWFTEHRRFSVTVTEQAWTLAWGTTFTNTSGHSVPIGSPTTEGRDNAGYGGLFWRGPRSFTGGTVYLPGESGGDEFMGRRSRWLGFAGRFDESGGAATLVFAEHPHNGAEPTRWFVRSTPFAGVCPAPYFDTVDAIATGATRNLRYAVTIADGDLGQARTEALAESTGELLAAGEPT